MALLKPGKKWWIYIVDQDNGKGGTAPSNNREYGGSIKLDGSTAEQAPPGPVSDPLVNPDAYITLDDHGGVRSIFHSHPSGTNSTSSTDNSGTSSSSTIGGTTTSGHFNSAPSYSPGDVTNSGSKVNYVFSRSTGTVYMYNNTGVLATIPQQFFVTPKH